LSPGFETVNEPPDSSSAVTLPERPRAARSSIARARRTIEILSGLRGGELVALNLASDAREGAVVRPVGPDAVAK
jgi:hypothetical protein